MKRHLLLVIYVLGSFLSTSCKQQMSGFKSEDDYPTYAGSDLGLTYSDSHSFFRIWSPTAAAVRINLYEKGEGGHAIDSFMMEPEVNGTWIFDLEGNHEGRYYTFQIKIGEDWLPETPGPYTKAVCVNGERGFILDLSTTDPEGWDSDVKPALSNFNGIIVYEIHLRDISMDPGSGIKNKGKYLGLTESGTTSPEGEKTGLDHLTDLGITHLHILPFFDFKSIDESELDKNDYNWGYEPLNYNVPEGSYSTNPFDPAIRIKELKKMVQVLHRNGIRVVMDVVYNHTGFGDSNQYSLSLTAPEYYYRHNEDGTLSDASACGNETASEKPMMRKFMMGSIRYWIEEYHIDGFRFDLMGIHDVETMNKISNMVRSIDESIFLYGEGWKAGSSPLPDSLLALKSNMPNIPNVAAFSDEIRDGLKGSWHDWEEPGFVSGNIERIEGVKFGIVGGVNHPQVDYSKVNESDGPWANAPSQCMVYVSCHDNHTLYDKLKIVNPEASEEDILKMHVLANTVVLTSQGVPFLHAGVDFVRTKQGIENSFESPDSINRIDWSRKSKYKEVFNFYKKIIRLRKQHPAFHMPSMEMINDRLHFLPLDRSKDLIGYRISGAANGDDWEQIVIIFNGSELDEEVEIPSGEWTVVIDGLQINDRGLGTFQGDKLTIPAFSAIVLVDTKSITKQIEGA